MLCRARRGQGDRLRIWLARGALSLALIGDSHAGQWFPALDAVAHKRGWRLTVYTKPSCAFVPIMLGKKRPYEECYRWGQDLLEQLNATRPDLVIVSHSFREVAYGSSNKADSVRRIALALRELWAALGKRGMQVVAIRDTPTMPFNVPECLSRGTNVRSTERPCLVTKTQSS